MVEALLPHGFSWLKIVSYSELAIGVAMLLSLPYRLRKIRTTGIPLGPMLRTSLESDMDAKNCLWTVDWYAKDLAGARSKALLERSLTAVQLADFKTTGGFTVAGSNSKKPYRIFCSTGMNIAGQNDQILCASISFDMVPIFDTMLAQKTLIELDEKAFLKIAHVWIME